MGSSTNLSGILQGGVLSPLLFNNYADCIIDKLKNTLVYRLSLCRLLHQIIMYAGDLLLISSSVLDLQRMLDLCSTEGNYLGINFKYKSQIALL